MVVLLDTCYSGAAGGRTFASKKTRAGDVDELFLERLTRAKGRAIITASRPTEVSIELPELGHGIFTYYLVQGLKGADLNRDCLTAGAVRVRRAAGLPKVTRGGWKSAPSDEGELEGVLPLLKEGTMMSGGRRTAAACCNSGGGIAAACWSPAFPP